MDENEFYPAIKDFNEYKINPTFITTKYKSLFSQIKTSSIKKNSPVYLTLLKETNHPNILLEPVKIKCDQKLGSGAQCIVLGGTTCRNLDIFPLKLAVKVYRKRIDKERLSVLKQIENINCEKLLFSEYNINNNSVVIYPQYDHRLDVFLTEYSFPKINNDEQLVKKNFCEFLNNQITNGLKYLHNDLKIMHNDIHFGNIMVNIVNNTTDGTFQNLNIKIIDINTYIKLPINEQTINNDDYFSTQQYFINSEFYHLLPLRLMKNKKDWNSYIDWWQLGVLLYEIYMEKYFMEFSTREKNAITMWMRSANFIVPDELSPPVLEQVFKNIIARLEKVLNEITPIEELLFIYKLLNVK